MKKRLILLFTCSFIALTMPAHAQFHGAISDETRFNRMTDWFATVGKSQEEKYRIKHHRRAARKISKARKRIAKQKRDLAKKKRAFNR